MIQCDGTGSSWGKNASQLRQQLGAWSWILHLVVTITVETSDQCVVFPLWSSGVTFSWRRHSCLVFCDHLLHSSVCQPVVLVSRCLTRLLLGLQRALLAWQQSVSVRRLCHQPLFSSVLCCADRFRVHQCMCRPTSEVCANVRRRLICRVQDAC